MAYTPNDEQKEFIKSENSNVLVSASAGSGKTSTMIQKLMNIILVQKVSVKNLMVLTFTDAAATEIKQKLYNAIVASLSTAQPDNKKFLKNQLDIIDSAEIGTLHSVCKKLIIKYFYEINESPDFKMLSEKESKYLIESATKNVFEKHISSSDDEFFELYESYNTKRNDLGLKKIIYAIINYLRNKADPTNWIEENIQNCFLEDLDNNKVLMYLLDYCKKLLKNVLFGLNKTIDTCKTLELIKYMDFLLNRKNACEMLIESINFSQFLKVINNLDSLTKPRKSKNADVVELDFDEQVSIVNQNYLDTLKDIKKHFISLDKDEILSNIVSSRKNLDKLLELSQEILDKFAGDKKKKNVLDFNDLEDKMLKLLENQNIQEILKSNYKFIFFDEYQDINEKQEKIVSKLVSSNNYYMIGDVKQSIYAFRQSNPKIFVNKFYKFQNDTKENKVINFNQNYRSDKNILEFNNIVFDKLITENTIGINYSKNSRFVSSGNVSGCNVSLSILDSKINDDEMAESSELEKKEAILVANKIAMLKTCKKTDGTYFDYKDIAIIIRSRGSFVKTLYDTLSQMQIPTSTVVSVDFYGSYEINLLTSIIKVASNFHDDLALSIVLKNLFDLNDDELNKIRQNYSKDNFFDAVLNYNCEDEIFEKLNKFYEFSKFSGLYLTSHTICEYLQKVLDDFDIIIKLKSMPNGIEKVNNVKEFLSLSNSESYKYNVDKFLDFLDFVSKDNELQKVGTNGNAVQIMTIHYSKGLEFPAVIMCGLGKRFNINKDTNDIIIGENFGFGLKSINPETRVLQDTLIRNACKLDNKKSEIDEEIRLLYVAMTRAKEHLDLIGTYNLDNFEKNIQKDIYFSKNYFDFVFKAVPSVYYSNFENRKDFVLNENLDSMASIQFLKMEDILDDLSSSNNQIAIGDVDNNLLETFVKSTENKPNTQVFTIKNTVTNILNEEKDYENLNYCPKSLSPEDKLESIDALELGTAYHSIMQNLNFDETKEKILDIANTLVKQNIISKNIFEKINFDEIWKAKENLSELILSADKIYKEKQFLMQQNYNKIVKNSDNNTKVIVQGVIDLVVVKNDVGYLIDYKTNKTNNEEFLKSNYALQLDIYKQAFEKATNIAIKSKFLYSFHMGKLLEVI